MLIYYQLEFPTFTKHLMDYTVQVAEYKYSIPVLRYDLLSDGV